MFVQPGIAKMALSDFAGADEAQLEHMGHKGELKRQFSPLFVTFLPCAWRDGCQGLYMHMLMRATGLCLDWPSRF